MITLNDPRKGREDRRPHRSHSGKEQRVKKHDRRAFIAVAVICTVVLVLGAFMGWVALG